MGFDCICSRLVAGEDDALEAYLCLFVFVNSVCWSTVDVGSRAVCIDLVYDGTVDLHWIWKASTLYTTLHQVQGGKRVKCR